MSSRKAAGSKRNRKHRFVGPRRSDSIEPSRFEQFMPMNNEARTVDIQIFQLSTAVASATASTYHDPTAHQRIDRRNSLFRWKNRGK